MPGVGVVRRDEDLHIERSRESSQRSLRLRLQGRLARQERHHVQQGREEHPGDEPYEVYRLAAAAQHRRRRQVDRLALRSLSELVEGVWGDLDRGMQRGQLAHRGQHHLGVDGSVAVG